MRTLITGSNGMLGRDLCPILAKDHEVLGADIVGAGNEQFQFYKMDITNPDSVKEIFDKTRPDIIVHTAAWTDVDGCEQDPDKAQKVNADGTQNIAKAAAAINIPVVYVSTDFVFDGEKDAPYREDDPTGPINAYGRSKLGGEEAVREYLDNYAIVRTSWLYGAQGKNFVNTIISKGKEKGHLKVVNDQVGGPTYTKDLSTAIKCIVDCAIKPYKETFHVSNTGSCTWRDFACEIRDYAGLEGVTIDPIESVELDRPATRPKYSVLDTSKMEKVVGVKMRSWKEALKEYFEDNHTG